MTAIHLLSACPLKSRDMAVLHLLFCLLMPLFGLAQASTPDSAATRRPPYTLKTTPLNLINTFQTSVDLQGDIPLSMRWGLELGVNVVLDSRAFAQYEDESYRGVKFRPIIKYYIFHTTGGNYYVGLAFKYNDLYNKRYVNVLRQGGQYLENILQRRHLVTSGVALRTGFQNYIGKKKRHTLEPFVSVGVRRERITSPLPPGAELVASTGLFRRNNSGLETTPDVMLGFSVGWKIGGSR